jgi:hypothetical protein
MKNKKAEIRLGANFGSSEGPGSRKDANPAPSQLPVFAPKQKPELFSLAQAGSAEFLGKQRGR